jgi:flagellin
MSLTIANNVQSLTAQHNLTRTSNALGRSLERLSSGFKINRGADGPAALVISETMRAQIAGLKQAMQNADRAVTVVQTAEGALSEINSLLVKARTLAVDSANVGVHDTDTLAANQAEITNILATIDRVATNTQYGQTPLLDGSFDTIDFQIGPNANQTEALTINDMQTAALGIDAIDVSSDAQGALGDIDAAIALVSTERANLGAFQTNTLESTSNNLKATLENTIQAESVIRDTDFAAEMAEFTKQQTLQQAGISVLTSANQTPQMILNLLRG